MQNNRFVQVVSRKYLANDFQGNDNSDYVYIPILKNAHSFGKEYFKKVADFKSTENWKNKNLIVFLRHPIKRWLSGVGQWFYMNVPAEDQTTNFVIEPLVMKLILESVNLDAHSDRQSDVLEAIPVEKTTFFNLDDPNFNKNLNHFVTTKMNCVIPNEVITKTNTSAEKPFKRHIMNQIRQAFLGNEDAMNHVKYFYQDDLRFYTNSLYYIMPNTSAVSITDTATNIFGTNL